MPIPSPNLSLLTVLANLKKKSLLSGGSMNELLLGAGMQYSNANDSIHDQDLRWDEILRGGNGNDVIYGGGGNDKLQGDAGDDWLYGGTGNDILAGGTGNDTLSGGDGADSLDGGTGDDVLDGGTGNDTLAGGTGNDSLDGGDGADSLDGGTGDDILNGGAQNDRLQGGTGCDQLFGGDGSDVLDGGTDNDILNGGAGADQLSGGLGRDTASYEGSSAAVQVNLKTGVNRGGDAEGDRLTSIENLTGSDHNDTLTGSDEQNLLNGGAGNDTLSGGAGADTLLGGAGDDTLYGDSADRLIDGGEGADVLMASSQYAQSFDAKLVNVETVRAQAGSAAIDINLTGQSEGFVIEGNNGVNVLTGGSGSDTLRGGDGNDLIKGGVDDALIDGGSGASDVLEVAAFYAQADNDKLVGIETVRAQAGSTAIDINLTGQSEGFVIEGNNGVNVLTGGSGSDTLDGGAGADTLRGGSGADVIDGGLGNDTYVIPYDGGVNDSAVASGNDTVTVNPGDVFDFAWDLGVVSASLVTGATDPTTGSGVDLIAALNVAFQANDNGIWDREAMLIQFNNGDQYLVVDGGSQHIRIDDDVVVKIIGTVTGLSLVGGDAVIA